MLNMTTLSTTKIKRAQADVMRVLNRYQVTVPEILGISRSMADNDERNWKTIRRDYEKIQKRMFAQKYPNLWKKAGKR